MFSVGTSTQASGLQPGIYLFTPRAGSDVNKDFKQIKPGEAFCFETTGRFQEGGSNTIILVQLTSSTTLKIEKSSSSACGSGPWYLTSSASEFER